MIIVKHKRCKIENIKKEYPEAVIIDVTSKAKDEFLKLSPFYPHGGIPIPFSGNMTGCCVEGIWQGLKVFEKKDVDSSMFTNDTMKNLKRTVRRFGAPQGHRKGIEGTELLNYKDARELIYIPTYRWMLENKAADIIEQIRKLSENRTVVLLDYNTSCDAHDLSKPLSHAFLCKAYVEHLYPFENVK